MMETKIRSLDEEICPTILETIIPIWGRKSYGNRLIQIGQQRQKTGTSPVIRGREYFEMEFLNAVHIGEFLTTGLLVYEIGKRCFS